MAVGDKTTASKTPSTPSPAAFYEKFTHLGRAVDPRYPTNVTILLLSGAALVIAAVMRLAGGAQLLPAASYGITAALATFLAWALGREIDPDHDSAALIAAPLAFFAYLWAGAAAIVPLYAALATLRVVARTVGMTPLAADALLLALGAGATAYFGGTAVALVLVAALWLDGQLPDGSKRLANRMSAAALGLVLGVIISSLPLRINWVADPTVLVIAVGITLVYCVSVWAMPKPPRTHDDRRGLPLQQSRVFTAQMLALAIGVAAFVQAGTDGIALYTPLWATLLAIALWQGIQRVQHKKSQDQVS